MAELDETMFEFRVVHTGVRATMTIVYGDSNTRKKRTRRKTKNTPEAAWNCSTKSATAEELPTPMGSVQNQPTVILASHRGDAFRQAKVLAE